MSRTVLAGHLEVTVGYLRDVEEGQRPPLTPIRIRVACEALGCPEQAPYLESLRVARTLDGDGYVIDEGVRRGIEGLLGSTALRSKVER